jgi:hypothetical protein
MKDSSPPLLFLLLPVVLVHCLLSLLFLHVTFVMLKECFLLTLFSCALDSFTVLCFGNSKNDNNDGNKEEGEGKESGAKAITRVALTRTMVMRADEDDSKKRMALARVP